MQAGGSDDDALHDGDGDGDVGGAGTTGGPPLRALTTRRRRTLITLGLLRAGATAVILGAVKKGQAT
jgi:hypothetical protein